MTAHDRSPNTRQHASVPATPSLQAAALPARTSVKRTSGSNPHLLPASLCSPPIGQLFAP